MSKISKLPKIKHLSLQQWYEAYGDSPVASLYVINKSAQEANLLFQVNSENGQSSTVPIPYSFAPIDLTTYAPIKAILNSEGLRKLLQGNYVVIADSDEVREHALTHPLIIKELNRIFSNDTQVAYVEENSSLPEIEKNPIISNILMLSESDADEGRLINLLETKGSSLTSDELEFLRANSKNRTLTDFVLDAIAGND